MAQANRGPADGHDHQAGREPRAGQAIEFVGGRLQQLSDPAGVERSSQAQGERPFHRAGNQCTHPAAAALQQRQRDPQHHQSGGADQHTLVAVQHIQFAKERLRHPAGFGNKPASLNNLID